MPEVSNSTNEKKNELQTLEQSTSLHYTSFDEAKKHLQSFSEKNSGDFGITTVETDGWFFGLGDHKVTGTEVNKVTRQVQEYFIKLNSVNKDLVKEFGQVYKALESLDKEYIPAILTAVKGAEVASDQAKEASLHAKVAQEDNKKTITKLKEIVKVLENHKAKLDKFKHLDNIDEIWNESKKLSKSMSEHKTKLDSAKDQLAKLEQSIKSLQSFANSVYEYEHLEDLDDTWQQVQEMSRDVDKIQSRIDDVVTDIASTTSMLEVESARLTAIQEIPHLNDLATMWNSVEKLNNFQNKINEQKHLGDIDSIWDELQREKQKVSETKTDVSSLKESLNSVKVDVSNIKEFNAQLKDQTHLFEIDSMREALDFANTEIANLKSDLEVKEQENIASILVLQGKIKAAYIISGGAIGLALLQLILNLMGVI